MFRLLLALLIQQISVDLSLTMALSQKNSKNLDLADVGSNFGMSYKNIMNDLRSHWQSPINYLMKRGYLPEVTTLDLKKESNAVIDPAGTL